MIKTNSELLGVLITVIILCSPLIIYGMYVGDWVGVQNVIIHMMFPAMAIVALMRACH